MEDLSIKKYSSTKKIIKEEEKIINNGPKNVINEKNLQNNSQNIEEINSLKSLINENNEIFSKKIKDIKNNIMNLNTKLLSIKVPNCILSKKDLEQNLIKQKIISNTILVYKEEFDSIKENILLLEEEKNNCSFQLYNLISMKDNYEEIIKENCKYIFKNLMISYDQNTCQSVSNNIIGEDSQQFLFNNKNIISVESYDINNIENLPKFSNYIYKLLSSHITSLTNENNIKPLIFSSIEGSFYDFIEKKINVQNFIKKIASNITLSDDKIHNFIIISRFEVLLKYVIKIFSFEKTIKDYMYFLNNDYLFNKNYFEKKYEEIKINIQNCTKEKMEYNKKYKEQEKEFNKKMESLNEIKKIKNEIIKNEEKIKIEENKYLINDIKYKNKIKKLKIINRNNNLNENDIQKTIKDLEKNINNLSEKIKNKNNKKKPHNNLNLETTSPELCNITGINNEKSINNNKSKINSNCYILITNIQNEIDFDPLKEYNIKPESKGYNKSLIILDNNNINIIFNQLKEKIKITINKNMIKNIMIHQNMKKIIYYTKKYNKIPKNNIQILLKEEENKNQLNEINTDELIKCIYNKYFCLNILLSNDKIINIIFLTYSNFKIWLKIFDEFCKNNK